VADDTTREHRRFAAALQPPFGWLRVVAVVDWVCPRCGAVAELELPAFVDWFDREAAVQQRMLADGVSCPSCEALEDVPFPLVQYRRADGIGLLVGFPARTAAAEDRQWLQEILAVAGDTGPIDGAEIVASARMAWWRVLWNQPLGPLLLGVRPLVLPETAEEAERWRAATVEALSIPDLRDALRELVHAGAAGAIAVLRRHPELVTSRWSLSVDLLLEALRESQQSDQARTAVDDLWRYVRHVRLLGIDGAERYERRGRSLDELLEDALSSGLDDRAQRLERLWQAEGAGPASIAAGLALVQTLHGDPARTVAGNDRLVNLAREVVARALVELGPGHQLTISAQMNLGVCLEEAASTGTAALAEAEQQLSDAAGRASVSAPTLIPDIATNLAAVIHARAATPADNPEDECALLAVAEHVRPLVAAADSRTRELGALVNEAAVLRARVSGSRRENARLAVQRLREALLSEQRSPRLSDVERVLVCTNLANALADLHRLVPDEVSAADVRAAASDAVVGASGLGRRNPVAIQSLANAGAVLTDLYVETTLAGAADAELWSAARDALEAAFTAAQEAYPAHHDETLRAGVNLAAFYGAPVDGRTGDPARCEQLLEYVLREAGEHRPGHAHAAAMNLTQLRIGQGRYDEAAEAAAAAEEAQARLLGRARTYVTRLGTIVAGGDGATRHALALVAAERPMEAVAVLEANRARLAPRREIASTESSVATAHLATGAYGTLGILQIPGRKPHSFITTLTARRVKGLVSDLLLARDAEQRHQRFERLAGPLAAGVCDPLIDLLGSWKGELQLVLCGALASCPMPVIQSTSGASLAERCEVREVVSASVGPSIEPSPARVVAVIDPDGTLPFARAEREAIGRWANQVVDVRGGGGARSTLLREIRDATALHLACHGRLASDDPMASRFELGTDAPVTVADLTELVAPQLELVVAPACQAASASPDAPDELLGAGHAFVHAGARAVIASLWDADDAPTALVVARFYAALANGSPPYIALAGAQRWVAGVSAVELSELSQARLREAPEAAWLPYDLAIEFSALTLHPDFRESDAPVFDHPADWAALSCLEA
jgi:CHAT domain-containing protein